MTKRLSVHAILFLIAVAAASVQAFVPVDHDDKWPELVQTFFQN